LFFFDNGLLIYGGLSKSQPPDFGRKYPQSVITK